MSEAPSVASPLKLRRRIEDTQERRERPKGGGNVPKRGDQATSGAHTSGTASRQQAEKEGRTGGARIRESRRDSGITSADGTTITGSGLEITGTRQKDRRKTKRNRKIMGYKQQVKPILERLLGQLELALLGGMEDVVNTHMETEWRTVDCPTIVRFFVNKQSEFARFLMAASSKDEVVGAVMSLHATWDKRKTKQDTEERILQEA
jgi:hypothetical protein